MSLALSVKHFCHEHDISRSKLYQLWREGRGPAYFKVGNRRLISAQAADAWRAMMEVETEEQAKRAT
jgi:hypothetical protein